MTADPFPSCRSKGGGTARRDTAGGAVQTGLFQCSLPGVDVLHRAGEGLP